MDYIDINSIIAEELNFDEELLKPIRESIESQGCHHPLLVQELLGLRLVPDEAQYKLIAGKKRFLAMRQLGTKEIPVKILPANLTEDQAKEYAFHENLRRYNLPWYEQVETELQLHELRLKLAGASDRTNGGVRRKGERSWTQEDTARELGISLGQMAQDINLAKTVRLNPSLSKVKDKTTALKLIKTEARRNEDAAFSLIPPEIEMNQVLLGDSLDILKQFPANIFDACITDPPWSDYARDESLTAEPLDLIPIFKEVYRVLKSDSFLYLICSSRDFYKFTSSLPALGFTVQPYPLIWQKNRTITHGRRNWQYARDYEPILLAVKGNPVLTSQTEISSILKYENLHYTKMIHPHEKPIELLNQIINDCTYVGGKVLDCFAGSGVTLEATKKMSRYYIGIERDKKFHDNIVRRLN